MPDQEAIQKQHELLATYRRTLAHLLVQAAQFGGEVFAPPQTTNGLHEVRENIQQLKIALRREGVTVDDDPNEDDRPSEVRPNREQPADLGAGKRPRRLGMLQFTLPTLLALALVLALAIAVGMRPFQNRFVWQRMGAPIPFELLRILRVNDSLLVSTTTSTGYCNKPGDTGLWRGSINQAIDWTRIYAKALEFRDQSGTCVLASIVSFAEGPSYGSSNRVIYAATSDVGLLASNDAGSTWNRIDTDSARALLSHVVVLGRDPEQVVVAVNGGGLYRRQTTGIWQRLDGATCPANKQALVALPQGFTVGALLATDSALYAGSQAIGRNQITNYSGLYVSRDGGVCWSKIDTANVGGLYGYRALVAAGQPDEVLVITNRLDLPLGEANHQLWHLHGADGRTQPLWETPNSTTALAVAGSYWYVATDAGSVARGKLGGGTPEPLPTLTQCTFERREQACFADLVAADETGPILLMGDGIYRLEVLPWYQAL